MGTTAHKDDSRVSSTPLSLKVHFEKQSNANKINILKVPLGAATRV